MSNGNIFISYRRGDTSGHAGRLYDRLSARFPGRVFMDVTSINLGEDFVAAIERHMDACQVFIELIGDEWATATDKSGSRRLDQTEDFVRLEVATALRRGITVIPVLVNGATMPHWSTLPLDIAPLTRFNALEITDSDFGHDVERLIQRVAPLLEPPPPVPSPAVPVPAPVAPRRGRLALMIGLGVAGLLVIGAIGLFIFPGIFTDRGNNRSVNATAGNANSVPVNAQTIPETASASNSNSDKSSNTSNTNDPATSQVTDELHTPPRDSSERRAITDALREEFSDPKSVHYLHDRGRIIFILHTLKVHNGWAWTFVEPRSEKDPNASFLESSAFLLHLESGQWRVMKLPLGVQDPNDPEGLNYPHPRDIENIRKMYPTMPADILQK